MTELLNTILVRVQPENELSIWPLLLASVTAAAMILRRRTTD